MKRNSVFLALALILFCRISFAQTSVPGGNVYGNWTLAGSPYNIQGNIVIPDDSTLTIDPGVTVRFQTSSNLYLTVKGRLLAMGTPQDTIRFTATDTTNGFMGVRFINPGANNDTSRLYFCKFQYGKAKVMNYDRGGALFFNNWSKAVVSQCYILNCQAGSQGAGICCDSLSSPVINYNTIMYNIAGMNSSYGVGAGIACLRGSDPVISYNTIWYNNIPLIGGFVGGAGIFAENSSPVITYNNISYNNSKGVGGGIGCTNGGTPMITYNTISGNVTYGACGPGHGGGIYCSGPSAPTISYNTISDNYANNVSCGSGGGIYCVNVSALPAISYNTIINNNNGYGGGLAFSNSTVIGINFNIISNNSASNNSSFHYGGAIYCYQTTITQASNNCMANNYAQHKGGALYLDASTIISALNNSIVNNSSDSAGALYCLNNSDPTFRNCIVYGNTGNGGSQVFLSDDASDPNFFYSDVEGGKLAFGLNGGTYTGTYPANNINSVPNFVAPSGGSGTGFDGVAANWNLQLGSPCINTGDPTTNSPSIDVAGNTRVTVCRVDMGSYENQYAQPLSLSVSTVNTVCGALCTGSASVTVTGGSGAITYSWTPGSLTTQSITNQCAGTYTVKVTEGGGCSKIAIGTIAANPTMVANFVKTPVTCNAGSDGTAQVNVTNGAPNYSYQWSANAANQTTQMATGLAAGNYTVIVTDQNLCTISPTVTINQPTAISITKSRTHASCSNSDGAASVIPSGGTPGYTYLWSTTAATQTVTGLSSGIYSVTVKDANLCPLSDTILIQFIPSATPAPAPICMVTVDSMSVNNIIMWDKAGYAYADSFIVHREVTTNIYERVGAVSKDSLSQFIDVNRLIGPANGDPNIGAYRYKLQVRDSCGNYSGLSPYHNSVWFNDLLNGSFSWNQYLVEGMGSTPVGNFYLRVDTNNTGFWKIIGSVAGTQTTINDPRYFTYNTIANWRIDATGFNCNPTTRYGQPGTFSTIVKTRSNVKNNRTTGIQSQALKVELVPNPAKETVTVRFNEPVRKFLFYSVTGELVKIFDQPKYSETFNIADLSPGMYFVIAEGSSVPGVFKFVKQ